MPYKKNSQLPKPVRHVLPEGAQTIFRNAFNASHKKYGEIRAFKISWAAVKKKYKKNEEGKWVRIYKKKK